MSSHANAPRIVAALPLDGNQPRFAAENLAAWGGGGVELYRWQVAPLPEPDRLALRAGLGQAGLTAAFISSTDEAGEGWTLHDLQEAFELARFFGAEGVITAAPSRGPATHDEQAAAGWLNSAVALAEASALPLLIENRPGTWAGHSRDINWVMGQADSPWLRVAFNPLGFVALREHPFLTAFMPSGALKSQMQLLRIQDAAFEDGRPVRLNDGNAEIAELVSAVLARGYAGFFSVGHSQVGLEDIRLALDDFRRLLRDLGLEDGVI